MRPIYFLLWIILPYVLATFYRRRKVIGLQKEFYAQTIFVCNHPSAFIDPLIIANYHRPIIHFMTRSDVFKPWLKPVTWACHMVPIYRMAEDGNENFEKNSNSFQAAIDVLKSKKSLIMFGEGYTDDVFIRSLKPMKKGPARIAFMAMQETNWEQDIRIQAVGVNYSHPQHFNCDMLLSGGKVIHLKEYKPLFDESPSKAITQLMRDIEKELQNQITYVKDKSLAPFVENIQIITRKGMNHWHRDNAIPLLNRYNYSKSLATYVNENYSAENEKWPSIKSNLENYFKEEKKEKINDNWVYEFSKSESKNLALKWLYLIFALPIFLLGAVHLIIPYIIVKTLVEKLFKRTVFWSGVKLILGGFLAMLFNLPLIWLFHDYVYPSYWLGVLYFFTVPALSGIVAYNYFKRLKDILSLTKVPIEKLKKFVEKRSNLEKEIDQLITMK